MGTVLMHFCHPNMHCAALAAPFSVQEDAQMSLLHRLP